jgi:G:T-mismatch repair DNA endonuclease (very short patch repair protein)
MGVLVKSLVCFVCLKECGRKIHLKTCLKGPGLSEKEYRFNTLKLSYPALKLESGRKLKHLYLIKGFSFPDFKELFGLPGRRLSFLMDYFEIPVRKIKEANGSNQKKSKMVKVSQEKYGVNNVLCKGTEFYHKRNETVRSKYGVDNVFQLSDVKEKINETHLERYGKLRVTNPEAISLTRASFSLEKMSSIAEKLRETRRGWGEERKQEYSERRGELTRKFWKQVNDDFLSGKFFTKMNKVEEKVSQALELAGLKFQFSRFVARRQFDFLITGTKVLIEVQGDYWHANPEIYSFGDSIHLPGGGSTLVEEIWERDIEKKGVAEKYGFTVIYIWERDIRDMSLDELSESVKYQVNSFSSSSPES